MDVTIKEKEEIQDLNNELETFMAEVEDHIQCFILLFIELAILLMNEGETKILFVQRGIEGTD